MKRFFLSSALVGFMFLLAAAFVSASEEQTIINFSVALDEPATVDRLVYHSLRQLSGFDMTVEAAPMAYAVQMANSGEKDALISQTGGLEKEYPNLVQVPEPLAQEHFEVYAKVGFSRPIDDWDDLGGLRIGTLMHKLYLEAHLPDDIEHIYRNSNIDLIEALRADACDVVVVAASLNHTQRVPDDVSRVGVIDSVPTYIYLNKKYEFIAADLAEAVRSIKEDGLYWRIADHESVDPHPQKTVLHISSYYADDPWESELVDTVTNVFSERNDIRYVNVALNANRALDENNRSRSVMSTLRTLYLSEPPDVLIASDNAAVAFVMQYYGLLFCKVPVIFCAQNGDISDQLWKVGGLNTVIYETIPADETVRLILRLFPDTKNIYVLNGSSDTGREWRRTIRDQLENIAETADLNIIFSKNTLLKKTLDEVAALPPNSVVLCGTYNLDSASQYYSQREMQTELGKHCRVPIFGLRHGSIGYGQVGGNYVESGLQGKAAARIALRVLDGHDVRSFPPLVDTRGLNRWMFDYRILTEMNIDESRLPDGSIIINRPPSLYETNPVALFLALLLFVLALLTILGLIIFSALISNKN